MKPRKSKTAANVSSEDLESLTDEQLAARIAGRSCPAGVPQELWDLTMAEIDEYTESWKAEVTKHIREYDRAAASKKASAKRSKPKGR